MAQERTFSMLKPGVMQRRIAGEIIQKLEKKGLHITGMKLMQISQELCTTHYAEHTGKDFFAPLVKYMTSGPVLAMVMEGEEAISRLRLLCGPTQVDQALPGTIRGDYAAITRMNIIHASDSAQSAEREISLFFRPEEIVSYADPSAQWLS